MKLYNNRTNSLQLENLYSIQNKIDSFVQYQQLIQPDYYILNNAISQYNNNQFISAPMFNLQELVDADLLWPAKINNNYCWIFHLSRLKLHCGLLNNWLNSYIWLGSQSLWLYFGHRIESASVEDQTHFQTFYNNLRINKIFVADDQDSDNQVIAQIDNTQYSLDSLVFLNIKSQETDSVETFINNINSIKQINTSTQLIVADQGETFISECQDENENVYENNAARLQLTNYRRYNFVSFSYIFAPLNVDSASRWQFYSTGSDATIFNFNFWSLPTRYFYKYNWPADGNITSQSFQSNQLEYKTGNMFLDISKQTVFSQFITTISGSEEEVLTDDVVSFNRSILEKKQQVYYTINIQHNDFPTGQFLVAYLW